MGDKTSDEYNFQSFFMIEAVLKPGQEKQLQNTMRILLVEDNPGDQRLIREILNDSGQSDTHWAATLGEGVEAVKKNDYDLVLLDLNLPDSDGLKTFERIYNAAPSVPIVVLTGTDDEQTGTKALALGAQDYLIKDRVDGYTLGKSVRFAVERKLAAEKIEQYQVKVARSELFASLGTISATMVHELSQPMTVINLGIENAVGILKDSQCPPEAISQLEESLRSLNQANEIINKFRQFGRNTAEKKTDDVHLQEVAEKIITFLNPSMRQSHIEVIAKLADSPPVRCRRDDIEQLFLMLIQNSVQAANGKQNRKLVITGKVTGSEVDFVFSDNCGGISPENQKRIFQPFFTTKSASGGTGLGLSIVQQIVSKYNGSIRISSVEGKCAIFYVKLSLDALQHRHGIASNVCDGLTSMEEEILDMIIEGRTNKQIAAIMHRSIRTVEWHRNNIMRKLNAENVVDLVKAAVRSNRRRTAVSKSI